MAKKQSKKRTGKKPYRIIIPVVAVILLIIIFIPGSHGTLQWYTSQQEKNQLLDDMQTLKARKAQLDSERILLQNDNAYIEKIAREKYNMKKKGEKVFRIDDKPAQ